MNSCAVRGLVEGLEQRRLLAGVVYDHGAFPFEMIDLTSGDAMTALDNSDDGFAAIDLKGKIFRYWDTDYTQLFVSANGLITFGSGSSNPNNSDLTSSPSQAAIAPLWDDWDTSSGAGSAVLFRFEDSDTRLVIEWNNVTHVDVGGDNGVTFQAILSLADAGALDNGPIIFNYVDLVVGNTDYDNGASATVGIKDAGTQTPPGGNIILISQNATNVLVAQSQAIRFGPPGPPSVLDIQYRFETAPQRVEVQFSEDVFASLAAADLDVTPISPPGATFNPTGLLWNAGTNTASFTFTDKLADGDYHALLPAGRVQDSDGNPLTADAMHDFFFLDADANHDRAVTLQDFNRIAANFGQSNRDFTQGDFNYDTNVTLQDFNILAGKFGAVLAPSARLSGAMFGSSGSRLIREIDLADDPIDPAAHGVAA